MKNIFAASVVCLVAMLVLVMPARSSDVRIINGIAPPDSDVAFDPVCRIGVIASNGTTRVISSTGTIVAPGVALVNKDSVFNTNGQLYSDYGGTLAPHFLRIRRFPNGASDNDATGFVYDVDITSASYIPIYQGPMTVVFFDPAHAAHISPIPIWFKDLPTSATTYFRCGHGSPTCATARSTEVLYLTRGPFADVLVSTPDYFQPAHVQIECGCSSGDCGSAGGISPGDSGGPWLFMPPSSNQFAYRMFDNTAWSKINGDSQRALRELTGVSIGVGAIMVSVDRPTTFQALSGNANQAVFSDNPEDDNNQASLFEGLRHTVTTPASPNVVNWTFGSNSTSLMRTVSSNTSCEVQQFSSVTVDHKARLKRHSSGEISVSVACQQHKTVSLTFTSPTGLPFDENQYVSSSTGVPLSANRVMARVPITVTGADSGWFGVKLRGQRSRTGSSDLASLVNGRAYWAVILDSNQDGVVQSGERVLLDNGVVQSTSAFSSLILQPNEGVLQQGVRHIFLDPGSYLLEVGVHSYGGIEVLSETCGPSLSESNVSTDSATLTIFPDAPCGSADFNVDGFVDFSDFDDYVTVYENGGEVEDYPTPDINRDGFLDFFDFDVFVAVFEGDRCDGGNFETFESLF